MIGIKYEQNNEIVDNISALNEHSTAEKAIHPKINFKYKDSTVEAYYIHDIEGGRKLYASVDDKANPNFKNAIESGLAKTFLGSNGVKFLNNSLVKIFLKLNQSLKYFYWVKALNLKLAHF